MVCYCNQYDDAYDFVCLLIANLLWHVRHGQSGTILTKFNVLDLISTPLLNVVMLQEQNVFLTLIMVVVLLIAGVLIGLFVPDKQSEVMNNAS